MNSKLLGMPEASGEAVIKVLKERVIKDHYGYSSEQIKNLDPLDLLYEKVGLEDKLKNPPTQKKKWTEAEIVRYVAMGFIQANGNGFPGIQKSRKGKRLLKALATGEKSKSVLVARTKTANLKDLIRDTNNKLTGSLDWGEIKIISSIDQGKPGYYRIKIALHENLKI